MQNDTGPCKSGGGPAGRQYYVPGGDLGLLPRFIRRGEISTFQAKYSAIFARYSAPKSVKNERSKGMNRRIERTV